MNHFTHRNNCRLCSSTKLDLVLPILPSAIGDAFVTKDMLGIKQCTYPLDTYLCLECGHLQNLDIVDPEELFRNYTYRSSVSLGLIEHFRCYASDVIQGLKIPAGSLIVELGSNDGSLLRAFKNLGMQVKGIDPAINIANTATDSGIPTIPDFFTSKVANQIRLENGLAALVCANNVFAHADNLVDMVTGIRSVLADHGVFVFEVSYVLDMIDNLVFDTIYHEHVSHHALIPLERFFNRLDMTLFDVKRVQTKGGSIRVFAQPLSTGMRPKSEQLLGMMEEENRRGILCPDIYRDFFQKIENCKCETLRYLDQALAEGKTIAAYGASTTTTTLLYHFELGSRVSFIVDDNPIKQGLYSPGLHLPVFPSSELQVRRPNIVVILAWIYSDVIIKNNHRYLQDGGEFVIPLPKVKRLTTIDIHASKEYILT